MAEAVTQLRPSATSELGAMEVAREQLESLPPDVRSALIEAVKTITLTTPPAVRERAATAVDALRHALVGLDDAARARVLDWSKGALVPTKKGGKR